MKLSTSRVPHLARAIAEKRHLSSRCSLNNSIVKPNSSRNQPSTYRCLSSTSKAFRQPPNPPSQRPNVDKRVPQPRERVRAPTNVSPSPPRPPQQVKATEEPSQNYDPSKDPKKTQRYLMAVSFFAILVGAYTFYTYTTARNALRDYNASPNKLAQGEDVSNRWCDDKRNFDYEVDSQEKVLLMRSKRRRLIREAYGDVLEVSVGTGRNMDLYDTRPYSPAEDSSYGRSTRHMITSLTFNDQSPVMVERAQQKWKIEQKKKRQGDRFDGEVSFVTGDAGIHGVISRPPGGYDTIVQSMGVCSMADPVKFLRHLGRLARQPGERVQNASPQKFRKEEEEEGRGGRIFLLEHGRGYDRWSWLNQYLDKTAAMHADRYGCWYNKDIEKVIADSGLVVERTKRYHFGTVWEIVLRPAPSPLPDEEVKISDGSKQIAKEQRGWWSRIW